jgi:hypothetical protein
MDYGFIVGSVVGISLFWTMAAVLWGMRAQTMPMYYFVTLLVGAFFWRKIMMMYFITNIKSSYTTFPEVIITLLFQTIFDITFNTIVYS